MENCATICYCIIVDKCELNKELFYLLFRIQGVKTIDEEKQIEAC